MPNSIGHGPRGTGYPNLTHALDAKCVHVRVLLLDKDRFYRGHVGIHRNVVLGQIGIHRTPGPWIHHRVLMQRKRHAPYHSAAELALHHARINNAARSKGANDAGYAHLSEIRIDLDLGKHGPMRVHGVIRLRGLICCALALSLYLRQPGAGENIRVTLTSALVIAAEQATPAREYACISGAEQG